MVCMGRHECEGTSKRCWVLSHLACYCFDGVNIGRENRLSSQLTGKEELRFKTKEGARLLMQRQSVLFIVFSVNKCFNHILSSTIIILHRHLEVGQCLQIDQDK